MKHNKIISFFLISAIAVLSFGPALAAPSAQVAAGPCPAGTVSGIVVAVDASTGTVTVELADGSLCTVDVNIDESHPVALLLGMYFGDLNPETLTAALQEAMDNTYGCAQLVDGVWYWVDPEDRGCPVGAEAVRVTGYNEDGSFTAEPAAGGDPITMQIEDTTTADAVKGALETLAVEWALESDGNLQQVSDQIAAYHDDGMGFGVLVKLYAIAQESEDCQEPAEGDGTACTPVTVEELVALKQSGVGMGQIFKEYGKPEKTGVGHVRQDLNGKETGKDKDKDKNKDGSNQPGDDMAADQPDAKKNSKPAKDNNGLKGVCNAISKNGKPKKNVICP